MNIYLVVSSIGCFLFQGYFVFSSRMVQRNDSSNIAPEKCPEKCLCSFDRTKVYCRDVGLSSLPPHLPISTRLLNLSSNNFHTFPKFVNNSASLLPKLTVLCLNHNQIAKLEVGDLQGLESLEELYLVHNLVSNLSQNIFGYLRSLKILNLEQNRIRSFDKKAFHSKSLQVLLLANNEMSFTKRSAMVFQETPCLKNLDISHNKEVTYTFITYAFQNLTKLEKLYMSNMYGKGVRELRPSTFRNVISLTHLEMNRLTLRHIDRTTFMDLVSLKKLYLRDNEIDSINQTTFPSKLLVSLNKLDLSGNPFHCDCNSLWFVDWIKNNKKKLVNFKTPNMYKCTTPTGVHLEDFHLDAQKCLYIPMSTGLRSSMFLSCLLVFSVFILSGLYRWRWKLRYRLFHLSMRWTTSHKLQQRTENDTDYIYDAFICYNSEESMWVNDVLVPELEQNPETNFKLCLYERDWLAGYIISCIGESIEKSRKIVLIVTNSFAQSQWCQLELTMAQHHLFETDQDNLILAIMEDIEPCNMTFRLAFEMKRRTFLVWTEDTDGQILFWEKLKTSLKHP